MKKRRLKHLKLPAQKNPVYKLDVYFKETQVYLIIYHEAETLYIYNGKIITYTVIQ